MDDDNKLLGTSFEFEMQPIRELYYNEQNYYVIASINVFSKIPGAEGFEDPFDNDKDTVYTTKLVGKTIPLDTSKRYNVKAKFIYNEKYGYQYQIETIEPILKEGQKHALDNNYLKAIVTEKQYNSLVEAYPNIVSDILDNEDFVPDFKKIKGIKEKTWEPIKDKIIKYREIGKILSLLTPLGVTSNVVNKLVEKESNADILKEKLNENPYQFTNISGFGFQTVDKLALKINPSLADSSHRVHSCAKHILEQQAMNGYLWINITEFGKLFNKIISPSSLEYEKCFNIIKELIQVERELTKTNSSTILHVVDDMVGLQKYYNVESNIVKNLDRINDAENFNSKVKLEDAIQKTNDYFSTETRKVELTDEQTLAIENTRDNKVSIITANAGCGKTVCIKGVIELYSGFNVVTAALSGKAARRIEESTGIPSNTIHRLLEWNPTSGEFNYNEKSKLPFDVIILDECSMIDDILLLQLLKAVKDEAKVVFVFDDAQLSPIGAGSPAKDLLSSHYSISRLTKIHRQAETSGIKLDANKIRKNLDIFTDEDYIVDTKGNLSLEGTIVHGEDEDMEIELYSNSKLSQETMFKKAFNKFFEILLECNNNIEDVIIIVPKKDGINSTRNFNEKIQEKLLAFEKKEAKVLDNETGKEKTFKKGAKVIQKRVNDYERNVMNGEIGIIKDITETDCIIEFDSGEKTVFMPIPLMRNMELAYAITVHSMQGSECKNIIVLLDNSHYILLDCALFYTAITRAQKKCLLLMQPDSYKNALFNNKTERRTYLPEILSKRD